MKCAACGYDNNIERGADFDRLSPTIFEIEIDDTYDAVKVDIYMCPKCSTLRGEEL